MLGKFRTSSTDWLHHWCLAGHSRKIVGATANGVPWGRNPMHVWLSWFADVSLSGTLLLTLTVTVIVVVVVLSNQCGGVENDWQGAIGLSRPSGNASWANKSFCYLALEQAGGAPSAGLYASIRAEMLAAGRFWLRLPAPRRCCALTWRQVLWYDFTSPPRHDRDHYFLC